MPELPEVETTCKGIQPHIIGQKVTDVIIRQPKLRWPVPKALLGIKNTIITNVTRRAKYILLSTPKGTVIVHLGMSGKLRILHNHAPKQKHDHVDLFFNGGTLLRYTDPRRFGAFLFTTKDPYQHSLLAKLGPEPFSKEFNANYLFESIQRKTIPIKQLIMDQHIVVGVGNIYANEALFLANVSPLKRSCRLTLEECQRLVDAIQKILKQAIKAGGTTLTDFVSPSGEPGYFIQKLAVYGRENEACQRCQTTLKFIRLGQRATVFCSTCQV